MKLLLLTLFLITGSFVLNAGGYLTHDISDKTMRLSFSWIKGCDEKKAYLNADYIHVSEKGLMIRIEKDQEIPLNEIRSDQNGIYTNIDDLEDSLATVWPIVYCKTCHDYRYIGLNGRCSVCGKFPNE